MAGNRDGAKVRAVTSHQCVPGSINGVVVGSRPCSERIFSGYSGFSPRLVVHCDRSVRR